MADLVKLEIDGKAVQAAPGTLVIDAAKTVGIEIPAFCYYEGLSLQAAGRMCLVEVEKMPKLMTACTLPVAEGMVAMRKTPQVATARKYMLEFLLTNHPLDCPELGFRHQARRFRHCSEVRASRSPCAGHQACGQWCGLARSEDHTGSGRLVSRSVAATA